MRCSVRGHPETPDPGSLSRLSPPPVSARDPVRIHQGEGVAGCEVTGPGQWTRTPRPRAARGPPPTHLGTLSWDSGARGVKAPLLAPPIPLFDLEPASRVGAGRGHRVAAAGVSIAAGFGSRRRRGCGRLATVYVLLAPCQRQRCERLPTSRAPGGGPLSPATPVQRGWASGATVGARRGAKRVLGVCCRGFPGTRLGLRRPLPQGFVLTGNVLLEGRGGGRGAVQTPGASPRADCQATRREMPVRPRARTSGLSEVACASQSRAAGWHHWGNSADWRWHEDEQGSAFSLVLGKTIKQAISQ